MKEDRVKKRANKEEVQMKKIFIILLVGLFVALCVAAFAGEPDGTGWVPGNACPCFGVPEMAPGPMMEPMPPKHGPGFKLSRGQLERMWQVEDSLESDTRPLHHALFFKQSDLDSMYVDPKADEAAIIAMQKEVDALRQKIDDRMVQFRLAQRKIFTAEQLKQIYRNRPVHSYQWPVVSNGPPPAPPHH